MLRKNQKEEMPFAHYLAQYAGLDPAEVTARLGGDVTFDGEAFGLSFLGRPYRLTWPDYAIASPEPAALALRKMPAQTFLLRYLERGQQIPFGGAWFEFPPAALGGGLCQDLQRPVSGPGSRGIGQCAAGLFRRLPRLGRRAHPGGGRRV